MTLENRPRLTDIPLNDSFRYPGDMCGASCLLIDDVTLGLPRFPPRKLRKDSFFIFLIPIKDDIDLN